MAELYKLKEVDRKKFRGLNRVRDFSSEDLQTFHNTSDPWKRWQTLHNAYANYYFDESSEKLEKFLEFAKYAQEDLDTGKFNLKFSVTGRSKGYAKVNFNFHQIKGKCFFPPNAYAADEYISKEERDPEAKLYTEERKERKVRKGKSTRSTQKIPPIPKPEDMTERGARLRERRAKKDKEPSKKPFMEFKIGFPIVKGRKQASIFLQISVLKFFEFF